MASGAKFDFGEILYFLGRFENGKTCVQRCIGLKASYKKIYRLEPKKNFFDQNFFSGGQKTSVFGHFGVDQSKLKSHNSKMG